MTFPLLSFPCLLHADELKLFFAITSPKECISLQSTRDTLVRWCSGLELKVRKCHSMYYSLIFSPTFFPCYCYGYSLSYQNLTRFTLIPTALKSPIGPVNFGGLYTSLLFCFDCMQPSLTFFNSLVRDILENYSVISSFWLFSRC